MRRRYRFADDHPSKNESITLPVGWVRVVLEGLGAKYIRSCEKDVLAARWCLENHGDDPALSRIPTESD